MRAGGKSKRLEVGLACGVCDTEPGNSTCLWAEGGVGCFMGRWAASPFPGISGIRGSPVDGQIGMLMAAFCRILVLRRSCSLSSACCNWFGFLWVQLDCLQRIPFEASVV